MAPSSREDVWPAPAALDGVKSRKKAIFKADKAQLNNLRIPSATVSLESRIATVGEESQTMLSLLQGLLEPESGKVTRHAKLVVAHLGPQLAGKAAESDAHLAAVASALKEQPQIVFLEEASHGGAGWARTFRHLIRSPELSTFAGAVIVDCNTEVTFAVRHICTEQWTFSKGELQQHDMPGRQLRIIEDALKVTPSEPSTASEKKQKGRGRKQDKQDAGDAAEANLLVEEARVLSEFWFEEDLLQTAREGAWTVAFLTEESPDASGTLRGFICYKWVDTAAGKEILIERVAVAKTHRKRGFGKLLMRWIINEVFRMPLADCSMLTCSALANVVSFYASLGFVVNPNREACLADVDDEPSMFMELPNASLVH